MGTRHQQNVIDKNGELKVSQYGQWDGYPEGQGLDILRYLKSGNLDKYQENLALIRRADKQEIDCIEEIENWPEKYPYLSRDCGARIHKMIEEGRVPAVWIHTEDWGQAGYYTINFQDRTFKSEMPYYKAESCFSLDNLPTEEEYLKAMEIEGVCF